MKTLSDFCSMEVIRKEDKAYIIFDRVKEGLIKLIGFSTDASKSDFEIQEEGYGFYLEVISELEKRKNGRSV